jgi:hypothetical protein
VVFPYGVSNSSKASLTENISGFHQLAQLDGSWTVAFDPKWGGPESITFDKLTNWTERPEEGIRYYSGTATYRKTFDLAGAIPEKSGDVFLDLGTAYDLCRVRLNGKDLGIVWTSPWRVNITSAVKATGNQLEIDVVNAWANRVIGDEQPANQKIRNLSWPTALLGGKPQAAGRYTFVTHHHYKANAPLRPAGLIGPVTVGTRNALPK